MIKFDDLYTLMERCKTPYVRIKDFHGNVIMCFEDNKTVQQTIADIQSVEEMLRGYGKLEVNGANDAQFKASYKGAYKWYVYFDKIDTADKNKIGFVGGWGNQGTWGAAPPGFIHQGIMEAKLDALKQQMEHDRKIREIEEKNKKKDGIEQYMPLIPFIMSGLGHDDAKIEKMMKWGALGKQFAGSQTMGFQAPTNTLTFSDVEKMTPEQKNEKIQSLLDSLSSKVSAEHMILLLEAIDKKPELAEKAVNFLPML